MADDKVSILLDLDAGDFLRKVSDAKGNLEGIGNVRSLDNLFDKFQKVSGAVAIVGTAVLGLKTAMDTVFEAENIKAINQQFEVMAERAGIAADALKNDLVGAAKGLVDDTDLLQSANKAIIEMGNSAKDLPRLFEVARLATAGFGGDLVSNFDAINHAIATGQTRALKNLGLIIDQDKAYKDYAKSIGVAEGALSQAGKQQAILNAVLERSKTAFAGINPDVKEAQNLFQQLKVTIAQVQEVLILAFDKVAGPTFRNFLGGLRAMAEDAKRIITANFGEGQEKAAAQVETLRQKVMGLKGEIIDLEQKQLKGMDFEPGLTSSRIVALTGQVKKYSEELAAAEAQLQSFESKAGGRNPAEASSEPVSAASSVDSDKQSQINTRFAQDLQALQRERIASEYATAQSLAEIDVISNSQRVLLADEYQRQVQAIRDNADLSDAQKDELIFQAEQLKNQRLLQMEEELQQKKMEALDRYVERATSTSEGIERAFAAGSAKAKVQLGDFGQTGKRVFDSFSKNATNSLLELGAGTKSAADVMKGFIFNMLADEAQARGSLMLAMSVWPPQPAGLAGGAALIALAGFLRSQAGGRGGGGASAPASGGGGSSDGIPRPGFGTRTDDKPTLQEQRAQKAVTIQVQGNYFETDQTKQRLVEMIREASDATDFNVQQIGG